MTSIRRQHLLNIISLRRHIICLLKTDINPSAVRDVGRLRTLITINSRRVTGDVCRSLKLVRILCLAWCDLDQIPEEIGKLIHLRNLNLSYNRSLSELPETIGDLYNLKYLFLEGCSNFQKFPHSIKKLINLRFLGVGLEKWKLLTHESLGKLVNLQDLRRVHVEAGSRGLRFLKNLNQLHEHLEIVFDSDYTDDVDDVDANEASLKSKQHMKMLTFDFSGKDVAETVVDALEPSIEVKVIKIVNFRRTKLPSWITSLTNLTELEVSLSQNIVALPPLGKLPYLVKLKIHKLSALKFIGRDFLGIDNNTRESIENACPSSSSSVMVFPALEELELSSLDVLEKWEDLKIEEEDMTNAMPQLKILIIQGCPKLEVMPLRLLRKASSYLKKLEVDKIELPSNLRFTGDEVTEGIVGPLLPPFPNLQYLHHIGPRLPTWISCLNYLTKLDLSGGAEVQFLPPLGKLPLLEILIIAEFGSLKFIGREFLGIDIEKNVNTSSAAGASSSSSTAYFPKLIDLSLDGLYELKEWEDVRVEEEEDTKVHDMPNLKNLKIARCPSLVVLPHRLFHKASLLQKLTITDDEGRPLKSGSSSLEALFCTLVTSVLKLKHFTILEFMEPKLPSWITSLKYLTELSLMDSKNVTSLPPLGKLLCLQLLSISKFSVLKLVGHEFLGIEDDNNQKNTISTSITCFPKLKTLRIWECKELEEWEDIKPEEDLDYSITLMPNLEYFSISDCPKLEVLPHRLLRRASSVRKLVIDISGCGIARENIVEDTELLLRVKVYFNNEILKEKRERKANSENSERSPSSSTHCCFPITLPCTTKS